LFQRKNGIAAAFRKSITSTLSQYPSAVEAILEHYALTETATSSVNDDVGLRKVLSFINDVAFSMPLVQLAANFPKKSYVLAFNEPNPWDGPFKGEASHILDVAFLFQNFNDYLSPQQRSGAVKLGKDVITYVSGEEPWPAFNRTRHGLTSYKDGTATYTEPPEESVFERNPFLLKLTEGEDGPTRDEMMKVFTEFMSAN